MDPAFAYTDEVADIVPVSFWQEFPYDCALSKGVLDCLFFFFCFCLSSSVDGCGLFSECFWMILLSVNLSLEVQVSSRKPPFDGRNDSMQHSDSLSLIPNPKAIRPQMAIWILDHQSMVVVESGAIGSVSFPFPYSFFFLHMDTMKLMNARLINTTD